MNTSTTSTTTTPPTPTPKRQSTSGNSKKRGKPWSASTSASLPPLPPPTASPSLLLSTSTTSSSGGGCGTITATTNGTSNGSGTGTGASATPSRTLVRSCPKARRVRFLRNGDQFFKGVWYAISVERFRSFEALLEDLNRSIVGGDLVNLPHGVRCLYTLDGQRKICLLDELSDGESYVCASNDSFKRIDYENAREPVWSYSMPKQSRVDSTLTGAAEPACSSGIGVGRSPTLIDCDVVVYPKIITVVRNGVKPRRVVRLLLNKRTARSFDQVLSDITAAIKLDSGVVKKLFTLNGKQVACMADFFGSDDVFIACGNEKMGVDDFYLGSEEYKFLWSPKLRPGPAGVVGQHRTDVVPGLSISKTPPLSRRSGVNIVEGGKSSSSPKSRKTHHLAAGTRPSPVQRRRFLAHKSQSKSKQKPCNGEEPLNEESSFCSESCLSVASSSFASVVYPQEIENRFVIGGIIGDGNFSIVRECVCKKTNERTALKIVEKSKCVGREEIVENEVQLLKRLNHPNIVKLVDFWNINDRFYLAMEFMPGGDLFDALVSARAYSESESSQMMHNLMSALEYLHDMNIAHRDVKPENLLIYKVGQRNVLKLADFGLAALAEEPLYTVCGTPTYVCPEILAETGYGVKVDVWAAGVIMYIMLCGFPPFVSMSNSQEELFQLILSAKYEFPSPYWDQVSHSAKGLIQGMLQLDADDRYSASEVLIHPWIASEARIDQDFEEISSLANQAAQEQRKCIEVTEYFYSHRRSMDDLSGTSADQGFSCSEDAMNPTPTISSD